MVGALSELVGGGGLLVADLEAEEGAIALVGDNDRGVGTPEADSELVEVDVLTVLDGAMEECK